MSTEKKKIENSIKEQCEEFENILFLLRNNMFDKAKYKRLYETLVQYQQILVGDTCLNRETAGYIETLSIYLHTATSYHDKRGDKSQIQYELQQASNDLLDLTSEIYFGG